jgi:hypothetical protein
MCVSVHSWIERYMHVVVVFLSWKLLDLINQTCSPFSTLPDMCIHEYRGIWRNTTVVSIMRQRTSRRSSARVPRHVNWVERKRTSLKTESLSLSLLSCQDDEKQHIIEQGQEKRVQQLFVHHLYQETKKKWGKKTEDKKETTGGLLAVPTLVLAVCMFFRSVYWHYHHHHHHPRWLPTCIESRELYG